jgi:hypothetical protein
MNSLLRYLSAGLVAFGLTLLWTGIAPGDADLFLLAAITTALLALGSTLRDALAALAVVIDDTHQTPATKAEIHHLTRRSTR